MRKMINETKKHGSKLCVAHNQIFLPSIQKAKSLVDQGTFDLLSFATIQKESFESLKAHELAADWMIRPDQKGIIWEVCCHLAYLQLHFLPDISEVYAIGSKTKYPVYDHFSVLLRTPSQLFGLIELSWVSNETEIIYEIRGSKGKRAQIYRDYGYFLENSVKPPLSAVDVARGFFILQRKHCFMITARIRGRVFGMKIFGMVMAVIIFFINTGNGYLPSPFLKGYSVLLLLIN